MQLTVEKMIHVLEELDPNQKIESTVLTGKAELKVKHIVFITKDENTVNMFVSVKSLYL